jgi:phosphomethylpyrimidine synthase
MIAIPHRTVLDRVAEIEAIEPDRLARDIRSGRVVVLGWQRGIQPVAFGPGTRPKFDIIIGLSSEGLDVDAVVAKAKLAASLGASALHDGSPTGDVDALKRRLLDEVPIPLGLCHPLRAVAKAQAAGRAFLNLPARAFIDYLEEDARTGADFLLAPYAVTRQTIADCLDRERIMLSPNKTGSMVLSWMARNNAENPYYEFFDEILGIAREHGVPLSFVNGFRAGTVRDAADVYQRSEFEETVKMVERCHEAGVAVTVGTGGHVPLHLIPAWIGEHRRRINAPLVAFGPTPTDIAAGYDHVVAAVGQSFAFAAGADAVIGVTAAEHLALPTLDETAEECRIAKLVCHMAQMARGGGMHLDEQMSRAREALDWEAQFALSPDPERARAIRYRSSVEPVCSMCGTACAYPAARGAAAKFRASLTQLTVTPAP